MNAPLPPSPAVNVQAARLAYGDALLFDGLDLSLPAGQWTCLLGPSGIGKTTLLRLIAGLPTAAGAKAAVTCEGGATLVGRMSYMAQQDLLLPWLSVLDNVLLGYRLRGQRGPRERAVHLLERAGLGGSLNALPRALSGGMRQRAALVRTLIEDRPVILMDEPFSALDAITRLQLQGLAAELLHARTVLLVTHDPLEALRLGERVLVMAGRPAGLRDIEVPAGRPPRNPQDPSVLSAHASLLAALRSAWDADQEPRR